ncbi:MAG: metallophosphoesterase [Acidobacteria bacterium]|nr:metallophosphoesterase [Acidobacteriota bacterium]
MTFLGRTSIRCVASILAALLLAGASLWAQVEPLGHPTVEERVAALGTDPNDGFRFVVFGDQKNLWDGEFPRLLDQIGAEMSAGPLLFILDTGDIVDDGSKAGQFEELRDLLGRVAEVPYLVGVGNHELQPDGRREARARGHRHTAAFLGADYTEPKMFFAKRVGHVRLLFLNTNDLPDVYPAMRLTDPDAGERAAAQLRWLEDQLREEVHPTIVIAHHAFVQSASKHRGHANALWNHAYAAHGGRTLPEILIDGGVDLVLTGHVHSYEVFKLERNGRAMWSVNASGKPTGFWFPGTRMPRDWRGDELEHLEGRGFETRLNEWAVTQVGFMTDATKRDQFALVTVDDAGGLDIELRAVDGTMLERVQIPSRGVAR